MPDTQEIFDIIDGDGNVIEESLTLVEAAHAVMCSDSREWEIRPASDGNGFVAWSRQQVANRPWAEVVPLWSLESDEAAARVEISRKIISAGRWPGHYEAVNRERRLEDEAQIRLEIAAEYMDDELREAIHDDARAGDPAWFMAEYERRHLAKYGEPFRFD